jgi:hypothetical protein
MTHGVHFASARCGKGYIKMGGPTIGPPIYFF